MQKSIRSYTISEFAELIGVDPDTLRNWEENGKLIPRRIGMRQDRRYMIEHAHEAKEKGLISDLVRRSPQRDYSKMTNEELIKEIQVLKSQKKFGLVWEGDNVETIEKNVRDNINKAPVLKSIIKKRVGSKNKDNSNSHILIEGDNYDTLKILNWTHKGKIDVIYIDPPYNTGNKDFVYNDNFVDKENSYRHSKWLSFMEKRLRLAYNLLSDKGVIFISIDDNEQARLKLLCDDIFGEENFVANFTRKIKGAGKSTDGIASNNDYVLFYTKNNEKLKLNEEYHTDDGYKHKDQYFETRGYYKLSQCLDYNTLQYNKSMDYEIDVDGVKYYAGGSKDVWKTRQDGNHKNIDWVWRWGRDLFEFGLKNDFIVIKKYKDKPNRIYTKTYQNVQIEKNNNGYNIVIKERTKNTTSLEFVDNIYSNDNAKKELEDIFSEKIFDYPKPSTLIKKLLKISSQKDSIVLDFFAGSGTTGHAVLELNKEDGGNRQVILATNNENEICEKVTFERMKRVMNGYEKNKNENKKEKVEGLGGKLEYMKVEHIDMEKIDRITDEKKLTFTQEAGWVIALRENVFQEIEKNNYYQIFEDEIIETDKKGNIEKIKKTVAIYFKENIEKLEELEKKILKKENVKLYIYSNSVGEYVEDYEDYKNIEVCDIPEPILKVYRAVNSFK